MKKINNKGFVISSILYTLLISFLLILSLLLLQFKSSSDVVNNASKDLVSGSNLVARQVQVQFKDAAGNPVQITDKDDNIMYDTNGNPYTCIKANQKYYTNDSTLSADKFSDNPPTAIPSSYYWIASNKIIQIFLKGKTYYWPKDFEVEYLYEIKGSGLNTGINIQTKKNLGIITYGDVSVDKRLEILWCDSNDDLYVQRTGIQCSDTYSSTEYFKDGARNFRTTRKAFIHDTLTDQYTLVTITQPDSCCEEDPVNKGHCKP